MQQDPVDGLAEDAQGWAVAGADGQLGPVLAQGAQLEVGVQPGEQASRPSGSQVNGSEAIEGKRTGSPSAIATRRPSLGPREPHADRAEQPVAAPLGRTGHGRQPPGRRADQRLLDHSDRQRHLDVVAHEHATTVDQWRAGP